MIKLLAILTKGLARGLSLFPIVTGSRQKLQDQRRLAVSAVKRLIGLGPVLGLVLTGTRQKDKVGGGPALLLLWNRTMLPGQRIYLNRD